MPERACVWGVSLIMAACGGEAGHGSPTVGGPSAAGEGTGRGGGGGASGTPAVAGNHELTTHFEDARPLQGIGLWMGLGEPLPVELPPVTHDGKALHLVGDSGAGLDVFFHTPLPVERFASEVRLVAYSAEESTITLAVAGPSPTYFSDQAAGVAWPEKALELGATWQSFSFSLDELSPTPPHEEMFGAVHLVVPPGVHFDFWIDDFTLVSRSR